MIRILGTVFAGLLGLAFGSFLNVCLSRWPAGESVVSPRSHCRNCTHTLAWWENIPLLSWLILRARCRNCRTPISWRYPLVELAVGTLWAAAIWSFPANALGPGPSLVSIYNSSIATLGSMVFYWFLVALAILDFENLWLPNRLTLPGIVAGFLFSVFGFVAAVGLDSITHSPSHYSFQYLHGEQWQMAFYRLLAILAAFSLILLIRWLYKLIRHRDGLGLGDAKLMALLAAWLGLPGALLAFTIGVVLGAAIALVLLINPAARTNPQSWATSKLPLGTFLCIGGVVSSLWGQPILAAYFRWAGF